MNNSKRNQVENRFKFVKVQCEYDGQVQKVDDGVIPILVNHPQLGLLM